MTTNKNKFLLIFIMVLLIANTIFTSILWLRPNQPSMSNEDPLQRPGHGQFLINQLGLDSNQQKIFIPAFEQHHMQMDSLREIQMHAKNDFFSLLKSDTASQVTVDFFAKKTAAISMEIDTVIFNHFKKLKSICNPTQLEKLNYFIENDFLKQQSNPRPQNRENEATDTKQLEADKHSNDDNLKKHNNDPIEGGPRHHPPFRHDGPPPPYGRPPGPPPGEHPPHRPHDGPPPMNGRPPGPPPQE